MTRLSIASDFQSPRTLALGGAGHAGPDLTDVLYLNPSYAGMLHSYALGGNYQWYSGNSDQPDGSSSFKGRIYNFSIFDSMEDLFQAGVGYTSRADANIVTVGAAKNVIQRLGFGIGGKFIFPLDGSNSVVRDMTFSTSFIVSEWIQVVGVIDNLIETDEARARNFYREFILGTKFNILGITMLYIDPHWAPSAPLSYGHEIGLETTPFSDLYFRIGFFRNAAVPIESGARGDGYGLGVGWYGPRMKLEAAWGKVTSPTPATTTEIGISIYF